MPLFFIGIPLSVFLVAMLGTVFVQMGMPWYRTLLLPDWTPPSAVFALAWSLVYLLVTLSLFLMWMNVDHRSRAFRIGNALFVVNGILNVSWTALFFAVHAFEASITLAGMLSVSVFAIMAIVWHAEKRAALLLAPYAAWSVFATVLTYAVSRLNV